MSGKILVIGGSGFVSGTLARLALEQGHDTWVLTRGQRPAPDGAHTLVADRKDPDAFARTIQDTDSDWDLVIDCIGYQPTDAVQDIAVFRERTPHLAFVSTDFVFDPAHRRFPQVEETEHYADTGYGGNTATYNQIFCAAGPDIAESRSYYEIIADILNIELQINETPVDTHLKENPNAAPFLCHRIYDLAKLKTSGAHVPATPLKERLRQHTESLLTSNA